MRQEKREQTVWVVNTGGIATLVRIDAVLDAMRYRGLEVVEPPERKPRPDAPGWWWIKQGNRKAPEIFLVSHARGSLGQDLFIASSTTTDDLLAIQPGDSIKWAIGPLPVPEGE